MAYPNNKHNTVPENITSANINFGLWAHAHGDHNSMGKVPKITGLTYLDMEFGAMYAYLDGSGDAADFGWTLIATKGGSGNFIPKVRVDGISVIGDGRDVPLSAIATINDYDASKVYNEGQLVHAVFNDIEGIYRRTKRSEKVWNTIECIPLPVNTSLVLNPEEYFYIWGFGDNKRELNGIYRVRPDLPSGIAIIITSEDAHDLEDHLASGRVYPIATAGGLGFVHAWQSGKLYTAGDKVYLAPGGVPDWSKVYECIIDIKQDKFSVVETNYLYWKLLADISSGNSEVNTAPIGSMVLYVCDDIPTGWLKCDGSYVNKHNTDPYGAPQIGYPKLYAKLGDKYNEPTADPIKFRLPTADNMIIKAE